MEISFQEFSQLINTPGLLAILALIWRIDRRLLAMEIVHGITKEKKG